jgi:hypothetical protein
MSILSNVLSGKITPAQGFQQAMSWLGMTETSVVSSIKADPTVQSALNTFATDGKAAIQVGADWAGTAISGTLSAFADEASTLVQKYVTNLIGSAGNPLSAAELTAIQALGQVGQAIVQHEVGAIVVAAGGTAAAQQQGQGAGQLSSAGTGATNNG